MLNNNFKINELIFENVEEEFNFSVPYVIVEDRKNYLVAFNPNAKMTAVIDEDTEYLFSKSPKYKIKFGFENKDNVLNEYSEYLTDKFSEER